MIKILTCILAFSMIDLKLKHDGWGFVRLPGLQENKLWTLVGVKVNANRAFHSSKKNTFRRVELEEGSKLHIFQLKLMGRKI